MLRKEKCTHTIIYTNLQPSPQIGITCDLQSLKLKIQLKTVYKET